MGVGSGVGEDFFSLKITTADIVAADVQGHTIAVFFATAVKTFLITARSWIFRAFWDLLAFIFFGCGNRNNRGHVLFFPLDAVPQGGCSISSAAFARVGFGVGDDVKSRVLALEITAVAVEVVDCSEGLFFFTALSSCALITHSTARAVLSDDWVSNACWNGGANVRRSRSEEIPDAPAIFWTVDVSHSAVITAPYR